MSKSLSDKLNSHHNIRRNAGSRKNRVNFIVLKDDISEALEHGWPMTAIWETLHDEGKFTASYNTFRLYVLEYLDGQKPGYAKGESSSHRPKRQMNKNPSTKESVKPGFSFNPIPNIEDLL